MFAEISNFRKIFHLLPVVPVYFVILTVTISVTHYYVLNYRVSFFEKILFGGIFYLFAFMVLLNHLKCMFTSPGYVSYNWKNTEKAKTSDELGHLYCKKCQNERPHRAHHCKLCKKCTLKMDHHCPWIANCVGYRNQKYFYQFLFFATFGDMIGFIILFSRLFDLDYEKRDNAKKLTTLGDIIWELWTPIMIIISSFLALSMTLSIGFLFYFQTKMIIYNQTTIESHIYSDPTTSPWYYNSKLHNFKIVMGEKFYQWILPVFKANPFNNGFSYYNPNNLPKTLNSDVNKVKDNKHYMQLEEYSDYVEVKENSNV